MLRHWLSVTLLLVPVMTFGWLISSVFIWKLIPTLSWVESLVLAACVTATDPVLASAVVGKGKFARRVPGHLRNLLSCESGCNDGMAFPFAYLALLCILHAGHSKEIAFHFIVVTCLYECVFGCVLGAIIGYTGRHLIKFCEKHNLIDRESFLVSYFVIALFCTGVGSIIGVDDLLVAFAAGAAFSWDGWFAKKTEESHVSDVIDLLLNMSFFVYFGAIIPWELFNAPEIGIVPWKLVIIAILIILFRRIPIMLALKPAIPDIKTWREALFCGHFGPIGVGAIFISILSRAELEHEEPTPLAVLPGKDHPNYYVVATIWPVTTFLIISSIIVHGSSIAVFTLGKRLNNMTITMTFTSSSAQNVGWMSRLNNTGNGVPLDKIESENPDLPRIAPSTNPTKPGMTHRRHKKHHHHHRKRSGDSDFGSSGKSRKGPPTSISLDLGRGTERNKITANLDLDSGSIGANGPHVVLPAEEVPLELQRVISASQRNDNDSAPVIPVSSEVSAYQEGDVVVLEDQNGEILKTVKSESPVNGVPLSKEDNISDATKVTSPTLKNSKTSNLSPFASTSSLGSNRITPIHSPTLKSKNNNELPLNTSIVPISDAENPVTSRRPGTSNNRRNSLIQTACETLGLRSNNQNSAQSRPSTSKVSKGSRKVTAYQLDNEIIVENEEGEIIRRYQINYDEKATATPPASRPVSSHIVHGLDRTLSHFGIRRKSVSHQQDLEKQASTSGVINSIGLDGRPFYPIDDDRMKAHLKQLLLSDPKVMAKPDDSSLNPVIEDDSTGVSGSDFCSSEEESDEPIENSSKSSLSKTGGANIGSGSTMKAETIDPPASYSPSNSNTKRTNSTHTTTATIRGSVSRKHSDGSKSDDINSTIIPGGGLHAARVEEEEEEETEFERKRRLAALGIIEDSDEEDSSR